MATKTRSPKRPTQRKRRIKKATPKRPAPTPPPRNQQLLIRTSERSAYQECKHQWQWSYVERRKNLQEAPALSFGNLIHMALEKRYPPGVKRGPHPAKTFDRLYKKFTAEAYEMGFRDEEGEWQNLGEVGVDMMENYVDTFGDDSEWEVIASEMTFQLPVFVGCGGCGSTGRYLARGPGSCPSCKGSGQEYLFTYVGTIDGLWRNRMDHGVRVNDYKTTKGDPVEEIRNVGYTGSLGLQPGAYWAFGVPWLEQQGILKPALKEALDGMVFTYLRKAKRDVRPRNEDGYYLNQPTKPVLLDYAKTNGYDIPRNAKVADLMDLIGDRALTLGEVSKQQPSPLTHREVLYRSEQERARYQARAIRQVSKMIELRDGRAEDRIKEPGWMKCRMCAFRDACELHELDSNWEDFLNGSTEEWDPYSAHEIEQEGRK